MERQEEKEKVLIPVRRETPPVIKELPEELPESSEVNVPEMPRRWYVF